MSSARVGFISLGCPKALVDSERILTQLRTEGYEISASYENADVVIVNTCGFIDAAKTESIEAIGEALDKNGRVIVTGCMGVNEKEILDIHPQVLSVTGPQAYESVMTAVHTHAPTPQKHDPYTSLVPPQGIKLTPRHYAYLKISEGCNHRCSFCIIPSMRGDLVSRPIGNVLDEAERLEQSGTKELLIISQDTSAYGVDLKYQTGFWQGRPVKTQMQSLCEALGSFGVWSRLHYVYPYPHVDKIIPLMAEGKILPYLDIPFQHASPSLLKKMKRPAHAENNLQRIKAWRDICPDIAIRSTFIVGFPGETEEDFQQLLNFIDEAQLERVGCFTYSAVDGATANEFPNQVPEELKQERYERFMELQAVISREKLASRVGKTLPVIIDEITAEGAVGRTQYDAPEIDGQVYLNNVYDCEPGDVLSAKITGSDAYDLWAELA